MITTRTRLTGARAGAIGGLLAMSCVGGLYIWGALLGPLSGTSGASPATVASAFALAGVTISLGTALGGRLLATGTDPRPLVPVGIACWAVGNLLAALNTGSTVGLYLGYGVLGGFGVGLGYVVLFWLGSQSFGPVVGPLGFALGTAVVLGTFAAAPGIAGLLDGTDPRPLLVGVGTAWLAAGTLASLLLTRIPTTPTDQSAQPTPDPTAWRVLARLWPLLFANAVPGMFVVAFSVPLLRGQPGITHRTATAVFGVLALGLFAGGLLCRTLVARFGHRAVFTAAFAVRIPLLIALAIRPELPVAVVVIAVLLAAHGGGFSIMPALLRNRIGPAHFIAGYGILLSAWGLAATAGALLGAATGGEPGSFRTALLVLTALMVLGLPLTGRAVEGTPQNRGGNA